MPDLYLQLLAGVHHSPVPDKPANPLVKDAAVVTHVNLSQCSDPQSPPRSLNMDALFVSSEPANLAVAEVASVASELTPDRWQIIMPWWMSSTEVPC